MWEEETEAGQGEQKQVVQDPPTEAGIQTPVSLKGAPLQGACSLDEKIFLKGLVWHKFV